MKNIFFSMILLVVTSISGFGQQTSNNIFSNFDGQKGYTSVKINSLALSLTNTEEENKEFDEVVDMIDEIKIIQTNEPQKATEFYESLKTQFSNSVSVKHFMSFDDNKEAINFYLQKNNNKIKDFILLVGEDSTATMISIRGEDLDVKKLKKLAQTFDIDGFERLNDID